MIAHLIRTLPLLARNTKYLVAPSLYFRSRVEVSFFRQSWRNKQYAITERIKKCVTSEQISEIIAVNGRQMNIVHLTAILDRIEEQGMLNIQAIVDFVVERLRFSREELLDPENERALCNIACYLGNLKNTELNHIFAEADFHRLIKNRKAIEIAMLITGLIRLGIFKQIFGIKHEKSKKELLLEDIITPEFTRNQILSIWYAYIIEISKQNEVLNNHLNGLLAEVTSKDFITLKTYTYAFICYVRVAHTIKDGSKGHLYSIIANQIPFKAKERLRPYQFSLLLDSINTLKRKKSQLDENVMRPITFPEHFRKLLIAEFGKICQRKNVTLRNIANNFKQFNEAFGISEAFVQLAVEKLNGILQEELKVASKAQKYEMNYKVDLLSLSSLTWKLGESFDKIQHRENLEFNKALFAKFTTLVVSYMKMLKQKELINKFTNKQLLMVFSGFALYKGKVKLQLDEEFSQIAIALVTQQDRIYSVKEITLLFTYFKTIKVYNSIFCEFVHSTLTKLKHSQQFSQNPKGKTILEKKCTLSLGSKCFNCITVPKKEPEEPPL